MNSAPTELLYALLFAAVLLVQYLLKRFGGRLQPHDALEEAPTPEAQPAEREASAPESWGRTPETPAVSLAVAQWTARLEAPAAGAAMPRQRAASRSLLTGQNLQRAVVGMTLLGPCRAQEPHESRQFFGPAGPVARYGRRSAAPSRHVPRARSST